MKNPNDAFTVEWLAWNTLRPIPWRVTHTLRPDLMLIQYSLVRDGWIQPIIVGQQNEILDGFHRWIAFQNSRELMDHYQGLVPVRRVEETGADAAEIHVRLNRARGQVVAKRLSDVCKILVEDGGYTLVDLMEAFGMTQDEAEIMMHGSLLKIRNIKEHKYSKAWVPVEVGAPGAVSGPNIESPPNGDR